MNYLNQCRRPDVFRFNRIAISDCRIAGHYHHLCRYMPIWNLISNTYNTIFCCAQCRWLFSLIFVISHTRIINRFQVSTDTSSRLDLINRLVITGDGISAIINADCCWLLFHIINHFCRQPEF